MLAVLARRKNGALGLGAVSADIAKIAASSLVMALAVWKAKAFLSGVNGIVALGAEVALGAVVYGILVFALIGKRGLVKS
jgi:hypothetical protein